MVKINNQSIACFLVLFLLIIGLSLKTASIIGQFDFGDFQGVILTIFFLMFIFMYGMLFFRLCLKILKTESGEVKKKSQNEFRSHLYLLFYVVIFNPILRSGIIQAPLLRLIYKGLGAKLGQNTYTSGIIDEPHLVEVGHQSTLGQNSLLIPHIIEYEKMFYYPIKIGNNVIIGANATIMAGVIIEDNATVAVGAVVRKGTHIGKDEVWGGVPAKQLKIDNASKSDANLSA